MVKNFYKVFLSVITAAIISVSLPSGAIADEEPPEPTVIPNCGVAFKEDFGQGKTSYSKDGNSQSKYIPSPIYKNAPKDLKLLENYEHQDGTKNSPLTRVGNQTKPAKGVKAIVYDGQYTITSKIDDANSGAARWDSSIKDHTGNPNGQFALFNATKEPGVFYSRTITGIEAGRQYEFSAWFRNIIDKSRKMDSDILPNIDFVLKTTDGTVIGTYNTGDIRPDETWHEVKFSFATYDTTALNSVTSSKKIVLELRNNATSGGGNDIAIDDIVFTSNCWSNAASLVLKDPIEVSGITNYNTIASPEILANGRLDTWEANSKTVQTEFGKIYNTLLKNPTGYTESEIDSFLETIAASNSAPGENDLKTSLTTANKNRLGEGGVVSIKSTSQHVKVSAEKNVESIIRFEKCADWRNGQPTHVTAKDREEYDSYDLGKLKEKYSCSKVTREKVDTTTNKINVEGLNKAAIKDIGFYQIMVNHCNIDEFSNFANSINGHLAAKEINTANETGTLYTKNFISEVTAKKAMGQVLGKTGKTSEIGFFDKVCTFDCENVGVAPPPGKINVNEKQSLVFFRDNVDRTIYVPRWTPVNNPSIGVTFKPSFKAVETTVITDEKGTPATVGEKGGQFSIYDANSTINKSILGGNTEPRPQTNFKSSSYEGATSARVAGEITSFNVRSTWASNPGAPQIINVAWHYEPLVTTVVNDKNIGFNSDHTQDLGSSSTLSIPVGTTCYYLGGSADGKEIDMKQHNLLYTGSGSKVYNKIQGLYDSSGKRLPPSSFTEVNKASWIVLDFVRAAAG